MFLTSFISSAAIVFLLGGGIYFSFKLSFPQFKWKKIFLGLKKNNKDPVTPTKSLMLSLAARLGVGSISGVALSIYIGGAGTIFWFWVIGIISSVNSFVENYLALKYRVKKEKYIGGPSYYIEKGLKSKRLALLYSVLVVVAYIIGFISIQANTIIVSINSIYKIDKIMVMIFLLFITILSIHKGLNRVIKLASYLVPIICLIYLILGTVIVYKNYYLIPSMFITILKSAFNPKSFLPVFLIGLKKAIFSTESGLGTTTLSTATLESNNKINLSLTQILGIYFTVFIVCSLTAFIILSTNYNSLIINNINGIELIEYSLNIHVGSISNIILVIIIFLLAYTTIIAGFYYGDMSLRYVFKGDSCSFILRILTILSIVIGSLLNSILVWEIVDVLVCLLAIINMYALIKLRKEVIFDYKNSK